MLGFAAMPPAAGLVVFGTCIALWKLDMWMLNGYPDLEAVIALALSGVFVAIPVTIGGVVPLVIWLIERQRLTLRDLVFWGAILGAVPVVLMVSWGLMREFVAGTLSLTVVRTWLGWHGALRASLFGLWFGANLAAIFWAVAVRGSRVDASCSQPERGHLC